jgi:hypothetical protein
LNHATERPNRKPAWRAWLGSPWGRRVASALFAGTVLCGVYVYQVGQVEKKRWEVKVSDATAWTGVPLNWLGPLSQVGVELTGPSSQSIADAEVTIDTWTDDRGTDLLIPMLRAFPSEQAYTWGLNVLDDKGGSATPFCFGEIAPPLHSSRVEGVYWTAGSPVEASPSATSMRLKGRVTFIEGQDRQSVRIEASDLREGTAFRLGGTEYVIRDVTRDPATGLSMALQSSDRQAPLASVRFVDQQGNCVDHVDSGRSLTCQSYREPSTPGKPTVRRDWIRRSPTPGYAAMVVEALLNSSAKSISFDVTVPLSRQKRDDPAAALGTAQPFRVMPPPGRRVFETIAENDWGPGAVGDASGLFGIAADDVRRIPGAFEYRHLTRFSVYVKAGRTRPHVASYDVAITGCQDSEGNALFPPGPARSTVRSGWELRVARTEFSTQPAHRQNDTELGSFTVRSDRLPSPRAASLTFEGVVKIKVGSEVKRVVLRGVSAGVGKTFTVGPVQITCTALGKDGACFDGRGDLGLISELTILGIDGKPLAKARRSCPWVYWSNTWAEEAIEYSAIEEVKAVDIEAEYYANCYHYVLPFKVTVPLRKSDASTSQSSQ